MLFAVNTTTSGAARTAVADLDGDGKTDLVATAIVPGSSGISTPATLAFFRNISTPGTLTTASMEPRIEMTIPPAPSCVEVSDLDGDGRPDLLITGHGPDGVLCGRVHEINTPGQRSAPHPSAHAWTFLATSAAVRGGTVCGDLDGDGRPEIILGSAGQRVQIWKNQFGETRPAITSIAPDAGPAGSQVSISGSGFADSTNGNLVYFGSRRATVVSATATSLVVEVPTGTASDVISVTVNGTTAVSCVSFKTTVMATRVLSAASSTPGVVIGSTTADSLTYPNPVTVADVDGDGARDVIHSRTLSNSVLIYRNLAAGGTLSAASFAAPLTLATRELPFENRLQDVDGDGKADLCVVSSTGAMLCVFRNLSTPGSMAFDARQDFALIGTPNMMECADLNADGKTDFMLGDIAFSTGRYATLLNSSTPGTISFQTATVTNIGAWSAVALRQMAVRDFDGDGSLDYVAASQSEATSGKGTGICHITVCHACFPHLACWKLPAQRGFRRRWPPRHPQPRNLLGRHGLQAQPRAQHQHLRHAGHSLVPVDLRQLEHPHQQCLQPGRPRRRWPHRLHHPRRHAEQAADRPKLLHARHLRHGAMH